MRRNITYALWAFLAGVAVPLWAHPVAYPGALALMFTGQADMTDIDAAYSVNAHTALGITYLRSSMKGPEHYLVARANWLVHRWNLPEAQGNFYVSAGAGAARTNVWERALFAATEVDYETRRIYFSAKSQIFSSPGRNTSLVQARVGAAPYVTGFEGLHSWVIAQAQYFPDAPDRRLRVGPVLRFFFHNILWEMGVSSAGDLSLNAMVHF